MTKEGKEFLEKLSSIALSRVSRYKAWNIPVGSARYAAIMDPFKKTSERILKCYARGLITEEEAAGELMELVTKVA